MLMKQGQTSGIEGFSGMFWICVIALVWLTISL